MQMSMTTTVFEIIQMIIVFALFAEASVLGRQQKDWLCAGEPPIVRRSPADLSADSLPWTNYIIQMFSCAKIFG